MANEFTDLKDLVAQLKASQAEFAIVQAEQSANLDNIGADLDRITNGIPTEGGATAEQLAELKADLTGVITNFQASVQASKDIAAKAKALADRNPEDVTGPVEGGEGENNGGEVAEENNG